MFVLTKEEKRVVCFVLLAIIVGLGVKEYRRVHPGQVHMAAPEKQASKTYAQRKTAVEPTAPEQLNDSQLRK